MLTSTFDLASHLSVGVGPHATQVLHALVRQMVDVVYAANRVLKLFAFVLAWTGCPYSETVCLDRD